MKIAMIAGFLLLARLVVHWLDRLNDSEPLHAFRDEKSTAKPPRPPPAKRLVPLVEGLPGACPENAMLGSVLRREGRLFATDYGRKAVFCLDDEGRVLWESRGAERFVIPGREFSLSFSPEGHLWVANTGKKQIEQLDPETGAFIASWKPLPRYAFPGCCNPSAFAALSGGRFASMEKGARRARIYLPSGEVERTLDRLLSDKPETYGVEINPDGKIVFYDNGTAFDEDGLPVMLPTEL